MKVSLIQHDPDALELLIFTKNTRLRMAAAGLEEIKAWPMEKKLQELEYMKNTIQSSWEFVSYTFMIEDVTRAYTHQLVRHRVGVSFAQQAQRAVDMGGFSYGTGPSIAADAGLKAIYAQTMELIDHDYQQLVAAGANKQDARGVLPTNIHTNICMKANLRTLHEMGLKRLCTKAQGEFQDVFRAIKEEMERVHPWTSDFIKVNCAFSGTCLFPTFPVAECPTKALVYDPVTTQAYGGGQPGTLVQIEERWRTHRAEAQPVVAKDAPSKGAMCECGHPKSCHSQSTLEVGCLVATNDEYCECARKFEDSEYDQALRDELST